MFTDEAVLAEDLGFDYVSTSEHHFEDDAWSPSQLVILSNIAGRTSRLRFHTNIFLLPLHHPLQVSEDAATVDLLSNGRMDLICGTSSVLEEFEPFGVPAKSRWSRFWEEMEIIRLSYAQDTFEFHGKHFYFPTRSARPPSRSRTPSRCGSVVSARSSSWNRAAGAFTPRAARNSGPSTCRA
jgi:alkanesulfonate monooxygenase SsuD/methylene tetrahydromethanopterin reductase-like flavin-dependent oxidoreductase (luciferase family)